MAEMENGDGEGVVPENGDGQPEGAENLPEVTQNLKDERDDLYDRLLRKQAEFENFKKRVDREKSEYAQFASSELMRELLGALDSFELAIRTASAEGGRENMLRGFDLIHKQLQDTLGRFGLKAIEAKGQAFDPHYHQAVSTQPASDVPENTVVDELRKGYVLNGRLLRPAMVTVSTKG